MGLFVTLKRTRKGLKHIFLAPSVVFAFFFGNKWLTAAIKELWKEAFGHFQQHYCALVQV